ncbi:hypothetical protein NVP1278O_72 [Vibrio phage 1.278.O._10N.286.54.E8]|nr:hypothetical protein NVP1278O_72 [Vibrio phage 1.278.O._10N.286.54.E8]
MENMTKESKLSFTSNPINSDSSEGFYSRCVAVKENQGMTTTENKYMIMARIAMLLRRKGLHVSLASQSTDNEYISMFVHYFVGEDAVIVEHLDARDATEQELLDWWSAIEG